MNPCNTDRSSRRFCKPIPIPSATQNVILVQSIISLNASLHVIGYADKDIEGKFIVPMHEEFMRVLHANDAEVSKFKEAQLAFVDDATTIIKAIDLVLTKKILDGQTMASPKSEEIWFAMARVNFNLQYIAAAINVRLGMLTMLKGVIPPRPPIIKSFRAIDQRATPAAGERFTTAFAVEERYPIDEEVHTISSSDDGFSDAEA